LFWSAESEVCQAYRMLLSVRKRVKYPFSKDREAVGVNGL